MTSDEARVLLLNNGWGGRSLDVWIRAQGRCEYCQCDLLDCPDAYLFGSEIDHSVPDGNQELANLALGCRACSHVKRTKQFTDGERALARADRIDRASRYISDIGSETGRGCSRPARGSRAAASHGSLRVGSVHCARRALRREADSLRVSLSV